MSLGVRVCVRLCVRACVRTFACMFVGCFPFCFTGDLNLRGSYGMLVMMTTMIMIMLHVARTLY